ncbi:U2 small nuclear ribonucleoprotein auxiliary factor 35 kDa subunit-related protein 2-like [Gordionus sp. m RMFG-2023]|uniref:U2 small nuclear ribonucleoprotein auxiliary factor 35 kDa subunit-related protein 2-like n=1 Tax=Gordionus sp. m RMFG-2023 TaxID=3053472 RepID=UPI0031FC0612
MIEEKLKYNFGKKLSHKKYKAFIKKLKRQKKRKDRAINLKNGKIKEEEIFAQTPGYYKWKADQEKLRYLKEENEKNQISENNRLWLLREKQAIDAFNIKKYQQSPIHILKVDRSIKKAAINIEKAPPRKHLQNRPTHNPLAPLNYNVVTISNESELSHVEHSELSHIENLEKAPAEIPACHYFQKVGACKYGARCNKRHDYPETSNTLLFPSMYTEPTDLDSIQFDGQKPTPHYKEFYRDVYAEMEKSGLIARMVTCKNFDAHLRGNVYVQYEEIESAVEAFKTVNGRWYAGRKLSCYFVSIPSWRSSICGLYMRGQCPKGRTCNYIHSFPEVHIKNSISRLNSKHSSIFENRRSTADRSNAPDRQPHLLKHRKEARMIKLHNNNDDNNYKSLREDNKDKRIEKYKNRKKEKKRKKKSKKEKKSKRKEV